MFVVPYDKQAHVVRPDKVEMTDFFSLAKGLPGGHGVQMGFGVFQSGTQAPPAAHEQDEYAFVLSGTLKSRVRGEIFEAKEGTATFIPVGEEHVSFNDGAEECRLVWLLVDVR
ncbi:MAG: cupin domain-containing protein [Synergistaceae bacterium]|jgi:mannose-6-phosphate isomerase-like protein (cupin superfamily)|nr:cupin domain-containing protein [Synergistaceae bacterium]